MLVAAVIVVFSFLLWRKRNGKSKTLNLLNVNNSDGGFTNLVYSELLIDDRAKGVKVNAHMTNPLYEGWFIFYHACLFMLPCMHI